MPHQRFPKVEILSYQNDCLKFILRDTDTIMANTIRRFMIAIIWILAGVVGVNSSGCCDLAVIDNRFVSQMESSANL